MKIIECYIGKSIAVATACAVGVLSVVLILGNLFKELLDLLINRDVPVQTVVAFILFVFPFSLTFTIPWGLLTGLLLVFGRISADNELIALRANGVSVALVTLPVFCFSIILTALCCWINIDVAPRAEKKMLKSIFAIATHNPGALFSANDIMDQFPDYRIFIGARHKEQLTNIILFEIDHHHRPTKMVHAKSGELCSDAINNRLLLKLYGAQFEWYDGLSNNNIRQGINIIKGAFLMPLQQLHKRYDNAGRLTSATMCELRKALSLATHPRSMLRIKVEIHRRFSTALSCIAFTLVAIPLGITTHRRETSIGFIFGMAIAFAYFFFIITARSLQENVYLHPDWLMWLPNILFITIGGYSFFRVVTN